MNGRRTLIALILAVCMLLSACTVIGGDDKTTTDINSDEPSATEDTADGSSVVSTDGKTNDGETTEKGEETTKSDTTKGDETTKTEETTKQELTTDPDDSLEISHVYIKDTNYLVVEFSIPVASPKGKTAAECGVRFFWGWKHTEGMDNGGHENDVSGVKEFIWNNCSQPDTCTITELDSTHWLVQMYPETDEWPNDYFWNYYCDSNDGRYGLYGVGVVEIKTPNTDGKVNSIQSKFKTKTLLAESIPTMAKNDGSVAKENECAFCYEITYEKDVIEKVKSGAYEKKYVTGGTQADIDVSKINITKPQSYTNLIPDYNTSEYSSMRKKLEKWFTDNYVNGNGVPFSFVYDGKASSTFISTWKKEVITSSDSDGKEWIISYKNPADSFTVYGEFILYSDYPTLEWTAYARNEGTSTSKLITDFNGMNISYSLNGTSLVLHTTMGSLEIGGADIDDYTLVTRNLTSSVQSFYPEESDGRSSEHAWPFFDVIGNGNGLMIGLGWTGVWNADFSAEGGTVTAQAKQKGLAAVVYAGETIRTPLYSVTYFDGDAEYGHNLFRKTVLSHYAPKDESGDTAVLPVSVTTESYGEDFIISDVSKWAGKLSVDGIWTDAAWFGYLGQAGDFTWSNQTGNWWISTKRYPSGSLKKVSDYVHSVGKKYIVWFEIERAADGTELFNSSLVIDKKLSGSKILNLASEAGLNWAKTYLNGMIKDNKIDVYRQDFNSGKVVKAWQYQDSLSTNRDGITEMRYIEGMYELYDYLLEENPGLMMDNCASGGKRIDLEMMKRMVILHRSDYTCVPYGTAGNAGTWNVDGVRYQGQNLSYWLPLHGSSCGYPVPNMLNNTYQCRSILAPGTSLGISISYAANSETAQKLTAEMTNLRGFFSGDYYSLIKPSASVDARQAFMYVRTDVNEAMLLVYRGLKNAQSGQFAIALKGLDANTTYYITDEDDSSFIQAYTGKELMENGFTVNLKRAGTAKVYILRPVTK